MVTHCQCSQFPHSVCEHINILKEGTVVTGSKKTKQPAIPHTRSVTLTDKCIRQQQPSRTSRTCSQAPTWMDERRISSGETMQINTTGATTKECGSYHTPGGVKMFGGQMRGSFYILSYYRWFRSSVSAVVLHPRKSPWSPSCSAPAPRDIGRLPDLS
jgi:hypothetical protein